MNKPLVSIALPTRNRDMYLSQTLINLTSQTYKNIEILISDNCSTDNTGKIIKKFKKNDSRIVYYCQKKCISGIENVNFTLSKAKGEFFLMGADDDKWDKNYIKLIVDEFKKEDINTILVSTKYQMIDRYNSIDRNTNWSFFNYKNKYLKFKDFLKEDLSKEKAVIFCGVYRTKIFKSLGGYLNYPAMCAPDLLTIHKIMSIGKVRLLDKVLFYKRDRITLAINKNKDVETGRTRTFIATIKLIISRTYTNLQYKNFKYVVKNVFIYFIFNKNLIHDYWNDSILLHLLNIKASLDLFLSIFPHDIEFLKNRNKSFTSKEILKLYNLF